MPKAVSMNPYGHLPAPGNPMNPAELQKSSKKQCWEMFVEFCGDSKVVVLQPIALPDPRTPNPSGAKGLLIVFVAS